MSVLLVRLQFSFYYSPKRTFPVVPFPNSGRGSGFAIDISPQTCGSLFFRHHRNNENKEKIDANQAYKMVQASDKLENVRDDASVSDSMSGGNDDKTIPFLRSVITSDSH